jgi:hypothetical protein
MLCYRVRSRNRENVVAKPKSPSATAVISDWERRANATDAKVANLRALRLARDAVAVTIVLDDATKRS